MEGEGGDKGEEWRVEAEEVAEAAWCREGGG